MEQKKILGIFEDEEKFEHAVKALKDANTEIFELFAPVPVHTAVRMVTGKSRIPTISYFLGIVMMLAVLSFLYYTAVIDWPLNFGGKPTNAFPSFIVVTLILTILSVTLISLLIFSMRAKLYPGKKTTVMDDRAVDDKFIIVLDPHRVTEARDLLLKNGAEEVIQYTGEHE
ncbi:MAG TPA: DUF3341 domain-containing protein [Bacteroidales bacterium]|nr:DUF3341 domain-containing protein [Bacteroidales bacterium]